MSIMSGRNLPDQQTPKGTSTKDGTGLNKGTCDMPDLTGRSGVTVGVEKNTQCRSIIRHCHFEETFPSTPDVAHLKKASVLLKNYMKLDPAIFKASDLALSLTHLDVLKSRSTSTNKKIKVDVINIIANPAFLLLAQTKLAKGSALGIDNVLKEGLTQKAFSKLASELRNGTYKPKPNKRVISPKSNQSVGISGTRDKVVQYALKIALEIIFNPLFSDSSHGFRKGKSCHSALKVIQQK
jgi:hypothetical protein